MGGLVFTTVMDRMPIVPRGALASVMLFDYKALKVWNASRLAPGPGAEILTRQGRSRCLHTFEQADP
jgi:hypothetical protein